MARSCFVTLINLVSPLRGIVEAEKVDVEEECLQLNLVEDQCELR